MDEYAVTRCNTYLCGEIFLHLVRSQRGHDWLACRAGVGRVRAARLQCHKSPCAAAGALSWRTGQVELKSRAPDTPAPPTQPLQDCRIKHMKTSRADTKKFNPHR